MYKLSELAKNLNAHVKKHGDEFLQGWKLQRENCTEEWFMVSKTRKDKHGNSAKANYKEFKEILAKTKKPKNHKSKIKKTQASKR